MSGKIWIDSTINVGTTVYFTMKFKVFRNNVDNTKLKKFFSNKNALIINNDVNEKHWLFTHLLEYDLRPSLASNIEEALIYLSSNSYSFECIIINISCVKKDEIIKIYKSKAFASKIIIVDMDNSNSYFNYDYKLVRPLSINKISELLCMMYISYQYQSKNSHNHLFNGDETYKISELNTEPVIDADDLKLNKINVLVAEDDKQNRKAIVALLNSLGWYNIVTAEDGLEAFTKLLNENFDIAFIDLKMPIMNGLAVVSKFKELSTKETVIIAVTASITEETKQKCRDVKMDGYIAKPIDHKALEIIMNSVISNKFKSLFK